MPYTSTTTGSASISELSGSMPTPAWIDSDLDPRYWWITKMAFIARMGATGKAMLASSNSVCRWVRESLFLRDYIDLKDAAIATLLNDLTTATQPATDAAFSGSGPMDNTKRDAIVGAAATTTDAERFIKNMVQPT